MRARSTQWTVRASTDSQCAPSSSSCAAPPVTLHVLRRTGYITVRSILDPRSGAQPPTVLPPSSSATPPTLLMPDQPRTAIIMVCQTGVDDGRGLSAACTARELNVLSGLPPFNWSPSVVSAERIRRALPCGKAFTGCRAPLRTPAAGPASYWIDIAAQDRTPRRFLASKPCAHCTGAGLSHEMAKALAFC